MPHRVLVSDVISRPGSSRKETGSIRLDIELTNASVHGDCALDATLRSLSDGIVARGTVECSADLTCNRCLTEWSEMRSFSFEQVYRHTPDDEDDEMWIEHGAWIDLEPAVHDEVALSLPTVPVCTPDCPGLCPVCGADLGRDPCGGHEGEVDSPFAALKELFEK